LLETQKENPMPKKLWGTEIVTEPAPIKQKLKRQTVNPYRWRSKPVSTDIGLWYSENRPRTLAECADLKKALQTKSNSKVGKYSVDVFGPKGMKTAIVCGPVGEVALKSAAARKLFTRRLAGIEQIIEVYLQQFGTEEPVFEESKPILDLD
jgi:hypothetical protein